jgi:bifunctional non-homologous end joining protein LigD
MATTATAAVAATAQPSYQEERIELLRQNGGSDKVYRCQLTQTETGWTVAAQWGRRNSTLTSDVKIKCAPYRVAKKLLDSIVREKIATGYEPNLPEAGERKTEAALIPAIVFKPELLTRITQSDAKTLASNPHYLFQIKHNGNRLAIHLEHGNIFGYNKLGQRVSLDSKLRDAILRVCTAAGIETLLIDGEWELTGFCAWDMLECHRQHSVVSDLRCHPYWERLRLLETIFQDLPADLAKILHLTTTAESTEAKLALLGNRNLEGVCVKYRNAPYHHGRTGQHKKYKFEPSASFIVGEKPGVKAEEGLRCVALYIIDPEAESHSVWQPAVGVSQMGIDAKSDGNPQPVRFVSTLKVPEQYPLPAPGSIVEVRYLYAHRGGRIVQPVYYGKIRDDVRYADCITAQLKFKDA